NMFEQRLSLEIYRLLAEGQPVPIPKLAERVAGGAEVIKHILNHWPGVFFDSEERVVGYWGLALPSAYAGPHRFTIRGQALSTWCAWDTLFLPQLLGETAMIESASPGGGTVRLRVTPQQLDHIDPAGAEMSFVVPDADGVQKDVVTTFCHFIHFFASRESGNSWTSRHPGTFLLSMDEALLLAHRRNELQYPDLLQPDRRITGLRERA
ncbi:MAG TPA: organomercurial lyase, partial [Candidatus Saccharimonadales bacterium]|nr:organomercurial lyase [Candidatus Saccharimonadales bacterium]